MKNLHGQVFIYLRPARWHEACLEDAGEMMRIIALSLSSFLLAHLANSEPPGALARSLAASFLRGTDSASPARQIDHTAFDPYFVELSRPPSLEVVSLPTAGLFASPGTIGPEGLAGGTASGAFREPVDERLFAVRRMAGDLNSTEQMLAAFGLRRFSFRVSSWRRLGPGPSVHAGTFSVVRNLSLHSGRLNIGLGLSMTMYRLGARFEPLYRRRPVSIHVTFRIPLGAPAGRTPLW